MGGGILKNLLSGQGDVLFGHALNSSKLKQIASNSDTLINPSLFATTRQNLPYMRQFGDIYLTGADDLVTPSASVNAYDRDIFSGSVPVRMDNTIIGRGGFRGEWSNQNVSDYMNTRDRYVDAGIDQGNIDAIAASVGKELGSLDDIAAAAARARVRDDYQRQVAEEYARSRSYQDLLNDFSEYANGASLSGRPSGYQEMMGMMQSGTTPYAEIKHRTPIGLSSFNTAYVPQYGEDEAIKYLQSVGMNVVPYSYGSNALEKLWM